jgi:hypothetical protein
MPNTNKNLATLSQAIIAIIAWVALCLQLYILISNTPGNGLTPLQAAGRFFIFFTILTNLLVAVSMTSALFSPTSKPGLYLAKPSTVTATAVYIFIVGLTYNIVLRPLWSPTGIQKLVDELLHVAVPLLFVLYWWFFAKKNDLQWKHALRWLIYPGVYLVYALGRGAAEGFYPYPFIDVDKYGLSIVLRNAAGLMVVFVLVSLLFIFIAKRMQKN